MASPLVDQFRRGGISREVRMTAASGALPLKPSDQVELLYLLSRDRDEEVRTQAEQSLLGLPEDQLVSVVKDRDTTPGVLEFFARRSESVAILEAVVRNPSTTDEAIERVVPRLGPELLELVVINQTRLLRRPSIIAALEAHPKLEADQRRRLNELKHDFKLGETPEPAPVEPEPEPLTDLSAGPAEQEEPPQLAERAMIEYVEGEGEEDLSEEARQRRVSAFQRIAGMTAAEKMIEAMKGDREVRMLLVRDRNRVVYNAVLSSPKLTESEVEAFAQMRNVSPEVLRAIGAKREWSKKYNIAHELVRNPLTPIEISMRLISRLAARDLKKLARDRNVSESVRRQATKLVRTST